MLTVLLKASLDAVELQVGEHLPGAKLRYSKRKAMTAVQHPELSAMGEQGVRRIARAYALPLVGCVDIKAFR